MPALAKMSVKALARLLVARTPADVVIHADDPIGRLMNDPATRQKYSDAHLAASKEAESAALRAHFLLGAVYGLRNTPGLWDADRAMNLLDRVRSQLSYLPRRSKECRPLERRRLYHLGLIHREVYAKDHFQKAAAAHQKAARFATTPVERLTELVCAACELMHDAVEKNDHDALVNQFAELRRLMAELQPLTQVGEEKSRNLARKWLEADVPSHRWYCGWLMRTIYPEQEDDITALLYLDDLFEEQYEHWALTVEAARDLANGDDAKAILMTDAVFKNRIIGRAAYPASDIIALVINGRAQQRMGKIGLAHAAYTAAVNYPGHGGHFGRAAARREQKALEASFKG